MRNKMKGILGGFNSQGLTQGVGNFNVALNSGDLFAALHNVNVSYTAIKYSNCQWTVQFTVTDVFNFEMHNPFEAEEVKQMFLWIANDLAASDQAAGVINPVDVEITYTDTF